MPRVLTQEEESLAALLSRAGLRAHEARCLALLLRAGAGAGAQTRADVARATGLAPQDVSAAMRHLAERGAVRAEPHANGAPGRPQLRYRLAADAPAVLAGLEQARRRQLEDEAAALDALRARALTL